MITQAALIPVVCTRVQCLEYLRPVNVIVMLPNNWTPIICSACGRLSCRVHRDIEDGKPK